jgi:hypothetical protein
VSWLIGSRRCGVRRWAAGVGARLRPLPEQHIAAAVRLLAEAAATTGPGTTARRVAAG